MFKIKGIDPTLKVLATPAIVIAGSILLAIYILLTGFPKVMTGIQNIDNAKKEKNSLEERLSVLQDYSKGTLSDQSNVVYTVLPNKNPGAAFLSQVKALAASKLSLILVSSGSIGSLSSDITSGTLEYSLITSDMKSAVEFLKSMQNTAPISSLDGAVISVVEEGIEVKVKTNLYWSALPTKLPNITEPLTELSAKDRQTLSTVRNYRLPQFVNLIPQNQDQGRANPFN